MTTTQPAPVLTANDAKEARRMMGSMSMHANAEQAWRVYDALQALADGRTACVEVRSEAQAREAFEKWYVAWPRGSWPTADGSWPTPDGIWFAALRYAGALKPPIVVCDECGAVSNDNHREDCMYTGEVR